MVVVNGLMGILCETGFGMRKVRIEKRTLRKALELARELAKLGFSDSEQRRHFCSGFSTRREGIEALEVLSEKRED